MQAKIYLALAGKSSHYYISARAGEHHLGLFVYKITGSRTVSPRALQNLVLFCLTAGDFSVVSACTTQIRDIFFTVPACITFCVMTRSSVRFPTSLEKDLSATVYSSSYRWVYSNAGYVQAMCTRLGYVHLLFKTFSVLRICKGCLRPD